MAGSVVSHEVYPYLKKYGKFLLTHYLEQATIENIRISKEIKLPLLQLFSHLDEDQLVNFSRRTLQEFLEQLSDGEAFEKTKETIDQWKSGTHPFIPKDKVQAADLTLAYHSRKLLLLHFIPQYTSEPETILSIAKELETFYTQIEQYAFQTFLDMGKEAEEAYHKDLQSKNQELATALEELQAVEEQLMELNSRLEAKIETRTQELQYKEQQISLITDALPVLIAYVDAEEKYRFNNRAYETWFNRSRSEIYGKKVEVVLGTAAYRKIKDIIQRVLKGETIYFESQLDYKDAGQRYVSIHYVPHIIEGKVEGYFALITDISEQKKAQEALVNANHEISLLLEREKAAYEEAQTQRSRLYNLFMQAPSLLCIVRGEDFVFELANAHYLEVLGITSSIEGKTLEEVMPQLESSVVKVLQHVMRTGERFIGKEFPVTSDWKKGEKPYTRYFNLIHEPLKEADGSTSGLITFGYEVSDLVQARQAIEENAQQLNQLNLALSKKNQQLESINTDLDNFIYTASHDLRSPIVNLEGLVTMLKGRLDGKTGDREATLLSMVDKSIQKLRQTISDLTEITKVQKDMDENDAQVLSFKEVLESVKEDIHNDIDESHALICEEMEVEEIMYSKNNLRSIFYNLLSNAIKYRSEQRPVVITIRTYQEDTYSVLSVTDNGLGLDEKQQAKLFTMFKRLHSHVEGTGIGLYMIKRIVENRGGRIEVESTLNEGTTFKVYFLTEKKQDPTERSMTVL